METSGPLPCGCQPFINVKGVIKMSLRLPGFSCWRVLLSFPLPEAFRYSPVPSFASALWALSMFFSDSRSCTCCPGILSSGVQKCAQMPSHHQMDGWEHGRMVLGHRPPGAPCDTDTTEQGCGSRQFRCFLFLFQFTSHLCFIFHYPWHAIFYLCLMISAVLLTPLIFLIEKNKFNLFIYIQKIRIYVLKKIGRRNTRILKAVFSGKWDHKQCHSFSTCFSEYLNFSMIDASIV